MLCIRIAICDDEEIMRKVLKKAIDEYSISRNLEIIYDEYSNGEKLIVSPHKYDVIILDYQLDPWGKFTGLSTAKQLRASNIDSAIIFLTSFPKVVFSSFEVNTFRFLVKPLDQDKLFKAIDDYLKSIAIDKALLIRLEGMTFSLNTKRILFLEGYGKYCIIHSVDDPHEFECHETLASVEERLPKESFYRCHRSYIVNMRYVSTFNRQEATLKNDNNILISRNRYESFQNAFVDYTRRYGF
jgi:DNA-binding LytR/AlgR family response regulator